MKIKSKFSNKTIDALLVNRSIKRLDDHINFHTKIRWQCLNCNHIWSVTPDNILSRGKGCPNCFNSLKGSLLNNERVDEKLKNSSIKRIDDYLGSKIKINWQCLICDYIWSARAGAITSFQSGCPKCNIPGYNEKLMHNLLCTSGLIYEMEFSIRNIDSNLPAYRLDAYFPLQKIAIEYNGKQHYEKTRFGSHYTEQDFYKQIERDEYIRNFCLKYEIQLIEIDGRKFYGEKLKEYIQKLISKWGRNSIDSR